MRGIVHGPMPLPRGRFCLRIPANRSLHPCALTGGPGPAYRHPQDGTRARRASMVNAYRILSGRTRFGFATS